MTNIKQQKSNLAKLMATENITVVHKKIPTAYFDVKNRILACPTFKDEMSNELYDLFMGHEVGHALYTPYEGLHSTLKKNKTLKATKSRSGSVQMFSPKRHQQQQSFQTLTLPELSINIKPSNSLQIRKSLMCFHKQC